MTLSPPADESRRPAWEQSYENKQNFVFYPDEEMVRFISKHLRKRTGFDSFDDKQPDAQGMRMLDVGCGIGRHMAMALDFGFTPYGFDLSQTAVQTARDWLRSRGVSDADQRAHQADIRALPFDDGFFGFAVSHGVLDSMPFAIAREGIGEVARVLRPQGLFYCDLIGGGDHEEVIETHHEKDTLQSFFTSQKIDELVSHHFAVLDRIRVDRTDTQTGHVHSRWHLTLQKR
ncbi:class I SAM-dependent methyltransferase [Pyruvatibacter sp.]|uniref:class I SAM-dependent methyltransferase n=1 Tax=Pyruvatibacter sp. TaxID=1981328 RepID=UPI0032EECF0F